MKYKALQRTAIEAGWSTKTHRRKRWDEWNKSGNRSGKARGTAFRMATADTGEARTRQNVRWMVHKLGDKQGHVLPSAQEGTGTYVSKDGGYGSRCIRRETGLSIILCKRNRNIWKNHWESCRLVSFFLLMYPTRFPTGLSRILCKRNRNI